MTLRSLTLSAAGEVASTNAAIVLTTDTPGAHILTTASGTGGTTIGTLATGSSTTTIANSDALIINASSGSGNIALSGNANGTTIAGALASSGGLNSSAGNVVLASGDSVTASVAAMPTGSSVISGTAVLALGAYGPADAMFATAFTDTAKLTVPANVAAASINGAVSFASGCSAHCADTAGVNLLDTIGSMKFIHGSSIVFVAGSKWGTPITSAVS
jgi:hypothetical protein